MAYAICMAESHCRDVVSAPNSDGSRDFGRFQVNSVHAAKVGGNLQALLDADTNVRIAAQIKASSGWSAWSTYKNGRYKEYLK